MSHTHEVPRETSEQGSRTTSFLEDRFDYSYHVHDASGVPRIYVLSLAWTSLDDRCDLAAILEEEATGK